MARDDRSLDELDEEMEKLEAELRALEEGEEDEDLDEEDHGPTEEEEADEPEDVDQETDDEEPEEDDGGFLSKLPFLGAKEGDEDEAPSGEEDPADAEPAPEPAEAEETEPPGDTEEEAEEDDGGIKGLIGRFKRDEEETEEEEPAGAEPAPEAAQAEETEPPDQVPAEERAPPETLASEAPAPEPETAEEEALTEEEARHHRASDLWERTPEDRWRRKHPDEMQAEETEPAEDAEGEGRARALLARFGGSSPDDEEEEETSDATALVPVEEEDEGRPVPIWILWILLGIAIVGLLAAAVVLLGDDDGGVGPAGAPTAAATVAQGSPAPDGGFVALVDEEVIFDASDTSGSVERYEWDFGDGQTATTETPTTSHAYASRGSVEVTLTAVGDGGEDTASIQLLVVQGPEAVPEVLVDGQPAAAPGEPGAHPSVGDPVTLDGSGSSADPESSLASYAWDLDGDGAADANGETAQATFGAVGTWDVNLTVTDDLGNTDTSNITVGVGRTDVFNDTVGQALGEPSTNEHPLPVEAGRLGGQPFELTATLNYTPPQAGLNENVDLVLIDPDGNEFPAEDDEGSGQENLTLSGEELVLGDWTVQVRHQNPSTNSVDYEVTVELLY